MFFENKFSYANLSINVSINVVNVLDHLRAVATVLRKVLMILKLEYTIKLSEIFVFLIISNSDLS